MHSFLLLFLAQIAGYLIGSIPFGYVVARAKAGIDIREHGSGNIGATNVGRVLGFPYFILVFLLDFIKGVGPVWCARMLGELWAGPRLPIDVLAGLAVILGHMFPATLGFRGGKGVATTIGVLLILAPIPLLVGLVAWVLMLLITRMVSAASIVFAVVFASVHLYRTPEPFHSDRLALSLFVLVIAALIVIRHRSNIGRILCLAEPQVRMPWQKRPTV